MVQYNNSWNSLSSYCSRKKNPFLTIFGKIHFFLPTSTTPPSSFPHKLDLPLNLNYDKTTWYYNRFVQTSIKWGSLEYRILNKLCSNCGSWLYIILAKVPICKVIFQHTTKHWHPQSYSLSSALWWLLHFSFKTNTSFRKWSSSNSFICIVKKTVMMSSFRTCHELESPKNMWLLYSIFSHSFFIKACV